MGGIPDRRSSVEMPKEPTDFELEMMNLLGRHIVSLRGIYRAPNGVANTANNTPFNFSGFVFNVREDWFLLTAGHVLKKISDVRAEGYFVGDFYLDDAYAPSSPFKESDALIPFDFDGAAKNFVDQSEFGDYAAIYLRPYYRDLLKANNVEPFSPAETVAATNGVEFEACYLIGLPDELMDTDSEGDIVRQKSQLVTINVNPLSFDELPTAIKSRVQGQGLYKENFFAQVPGANELTNGDEPGLQSIVGMSGGPIIGWRRNSAGRLYYGLVAIQSTWWEESRVLMACPAARYISALDHTIQKANAMLAMLSAAGADEPEL